MGSTVTLAVPGLEYNVVAPEYGYKTRVINPFHFQRKLPIGYASYDDGTDYDIRVWDGTFILPQTQAETLLNFYLDSDKSRGIAAGLRLPFNSGFTPFGPDKGDYGNYGVTLHDISISGPLMTPYKYFAVNCSMTANSYPSRPVPEIRYDGSFSIGSVSGLRFPDRFPQSEISPGVMKKFTRDGTGSIIDRLPSTDHYESALRMICGRSRAHALFTYLTGVIRTGNLSFSADAGTYLFGPIKGSSGSYIAQWVDKEVSVTHSNFNRYEFNLTFSLVSVL